MSDKKHELEEQTGIAIEERLKKPSLYKVVLLNDDYTPMDFVIHVLKTIFKKDEKTAHEIMLSVHNEGRGIAGTYSHEIAETKSFQTNEYAKKSQHPLKSIVEKE
jgi:ATP-dependent Clp protease adaptor protein ClpS